MNFFADMFSVFKKREISFIESYKESGDVYSFIFEKENDFTWNAGQYGLISIIHRKIKNPTKPFSIASSPSENIIKLTTRINNDPSEFKKALLELKQGMKVKTSGPVGSFYLQDDSPSLLIAGGIGITPFRSILKQLEAEGNRNGTQRNLLYLDSKKTFIYKNELDNVANNTSVNISYLDAKDDLHNEIDRFNDMHKNNSCYYIAGPKSMVESITGYIQSKNISKGRIKKDAFLGY